MTKDTYQRAKVFKGKGLKKKSGDTEAQNLLDEKIGAKNKT